MDDEIYARLFCPLLEGENKTKNVVAVFDSCHSGDVGRDPLQQARWVDPVEGESNEVAATGRSGMFEEELDLVLISACESGQVARERTFEEGVRGVLTHFWVKELERLGDLWKEDPDEPRAIEETYLSVVDRVRSAVQGYVEGQRPVVQGGLKDTQFFGTEQLTPDPYLIAERRDVTVVEVAGGEALGFTKGSVFGLFDSTTVDFDDVTKKVAEAELFQVGDLTSLGRLRGETLREGLNTLPEGPFRAIELVHNYVGHRFPVAIVGESNAPPLSTLVARLGEFEQVEVVDPGTEIATILVRRYRPDGASEDYVRLEGDDGRILSGPFAVTDPEAADTLAKAIAGWCQWHRILKLDNKDADESTSVQIEVRPTEFVPGRGVGEYFEGEEVEFSVTLRSRSMRSYYIALVDLVDNGEIKLLFASDQPLAPGRIPLGVTNADMLAEGQESKREWLKVFASFKPLPFQYIEQEVIRDLREFKQVEIRDLREVGAAQDPLYELLMEGLDVEQRFGRRCPEPSGLRRPCRPSHSSETVTEGEFRDTAGRLIVALMQLT